MTTIEFRKDLFADERDDDLNEVGRPRVRHDILGHVTGKSEYFDDCRFDGLLHMRCARSPHHHARIRSVDVSAAERTPGFVRVVRPADVPRNMNTLLSLIGFGRDDEALLQPSKCAYRGEPFLAVIAETERAAREAVRAVRVDWEELPHVLDVEEALAPGAPVVNAEYPNNSFDYHDLYDHQKLRFGDTETVLARADRVVEGEYRMSPVEQAPIETCGAVAVPEGNGRYLCRTATQALFFSLGTTAKLLDLPSSKLHFVGGTVGGGFGGKVDSIVEPMAVLGAMLTGRPVRFAWDRAEEMQAGGPRGAELWRIRDGVMADGRIVARQLVGFFDSGAYTRLSSYAVVKATGHVPGPYSIPNVASNVYCVFTNRTPSTAMRGFGITAMDFAIERHMDKVAEAVGMDPISLRIRNAYRDGDMKAHRRTAKNAALVECCQVAAEKAGWSLPAEDRAASSLLGGGSPERAAIPETVTDQAGRVGERRLSGIGAWPFDGAESRGRVPAGAARPRNLKAVDPQSPDMAADPTRMGLRFARTLEPEMPGAPSPPPYTASNALPAASPIHAAPPPAAQRPPAAVPQAATAPRARNAAPPSAPPAKPERKPDPKIRRSGVSGFISGTGRRR